MSNFFPTADADFVTYMNDHAARWALNQGQIGLSSSATTAFTARTIQMTKDWQSYNDAKQALIDARDTWLNSKGQTRALAAADVKIIKAFAVNSSNPTAVYTAASIPAPKVPVSGVAPGQPTQVRATLNTVTGELKLNWKCVNPGTTSGTVYVVQRRTGTSGGWTNIGLSSTRSFTDGTLTAAPVVQYQITATRSGISGVPSGPVTVTFGQSPGGEAFVASVKMAA